MSATALHRKSTAGSRAVTARRYVFDHPGMERHFINDDLLVSHVVAVASALIPPGEEFIAKAVRRERDNIDGPLRDQINGFIGQERLHQREHDRFNEALAALGYPTAEIDRASEVIFGLARRLPNHIQVALTAAIEHWTAVVSEHVLADDQLEAWHVADSARAFLDWHMLEELEHRAVAFDAMQATGVSELERIAAMHVGQMLLLPVVVLGVAVSLARDPATLNPVAWARSLARLPRLAIVRPRFLRDLLSWNRPGFHPDERNVDELLSRWKEALFGPEGSVTALAS